MRSFKPNQKASRGSKKMSNSDETALAPSQSGIKISAIEASLAKLTKAHPDERTTDFQQYIPDNTIIVESDKSNKYHPAQFKRGSKDDFEQVKNEEFSDDEDVACCQKAKTTSSILIPGDSADKLNLNFRGKANHDENCDNVSFQSTDFQTAYENQSTNEHSEDPKSNNDMSALAAAPNNGFDSVTFSRRGSFDVNTSVSIEEGEQLETSIEPEQYVNAPAKDVQQKKSTFKYNPNAMPFFKPATTFVPQTDKMSDTSSQGKNEQKGNLLKQGLDDLTLNNEFTPSTPYVHKFRTEMCKNWELYGKCKYGDECSFAHGKTHMMIKTDVSALYKTKLCKKYSANGYCPYGMRCQFIHDISDASPAVKAQIMGPKVAAKAPAPVVQTTAVQAKVFKQWKPVAAAEPQQQSSINANAPAFVPTAQPAPVAAPATTAAPKVAPIGGFGNKQRQIGLAVEKVDYKEILLHSATVSVQEYQKKMKMYNNSQIYEEPTIEYVNFYSEQVPRLGLFQDIASSDSSSSLDEDMY